MLTTMGFSMVCSASQIWADPVTEPPGLSTRRMMALTLGSPAAFSKSRITRPLTASPPEPDWSPLRMVPSMRTMATASPNPAPDVPGALANPKMLAPNTAVPASTAQLQTGSKNPTTTPISTHKGVRSVFLVSPDAGCSACGRPDGERSGDKTAVGSSIIN